MCRAKDDPKCRRCKTTDPVASASRGKAYEASKKGEGLTAAPVALAAVALLTAPVNNGTRDIEALRALAASIDRAFADEDPSAIADLKRDYGSPLGAIRALGAAVTSRGEELAGITAEEVTDSWHKRKEAARQAIPDLRQARDDRVAQDMAEFDAWAAEHHPGVNWEDTGGPGSLRQLRNQYVSEESKAAGAAVIEAEARWEKSGIQSATDPESLLDLRRIADGCEAAMAEIRPLGGHLELHELSDPAAVLAVTEAMGIYPADWACASSDAGPLAVVVSEGRSQHNPFAVHSERVAAEPSFHIVPAGSARTDTPECSYLAVENGIGAYGREDPSYDRWLTQKWEVKRVKGKPKGCDWEAVEPSVWRRKERGTIKGAGLELSMKGRELPARPKGFAVAAHELGHRMQTVVPGLSRMEDAWLVDRTTVNGKREELVPLWEGSNEFVRTDNFPLAYIGKEYSDMMGDTREATEVITMGTQGIFGGDHGGLIGMGSIRRDDDMRAFILGAMASAGFRR